MINFNYRYISKDYMNILLLILMFILYILLPVLISDREMFIINNPAISPVHIVPEWYYLFAYAILRSIPNKLIGVVAFVIRVLILSSITVKNNIFHNNLLLTLLLIIVVLNLISLGYIVAEAPYIILSKVFTLLYFRLIIILIV